MFKKKLVYTFGGISMEIGNLSQNQIITTFGPGAIIDAKEDSVMGLDINYWNNDGRI